MERDNNFVASVSRQDWSLNRRGEKDSARHNEKVKESLKGNIGDLVSDGTIITSDPNSKKTVKIPMRSLELPRLRYGDEEDGVGSGPGEPGDGVGEDGEGGKQAGDQPGEEFYETEMTIEEIKGLVFADLGLPNIKPREAHDIESEEVAFNDVRKKRTTNNIDMSRTALQNILRNAMQTGVAKIQNISPEDFRVRTWEEERKPENNAVVIAMADISLSMGEFEKYVTRSFCWWAVEFLRTKYPKVEIVFVVHDVEAHEVNEEQFFTRGAGGGTKCSSANEMALDMVEHRYPTDRYNVYPMHFSDGDNYGSDNDLCVDMVQRMLDDEVNQYGYVQIGKPRPSQLLTKYRSDIHNDRFKGLMIERKEDVFKALQDMFSSDGAMEL